MHARACGAIGSLSTTSLSPTADGADVLQISPLGGAPLTNPVPDANWGLHLTDANIALGDLVDLTARQARAYEAKHAAK